MNLGVTNDELLVDGSIIAENPSLYSTIYQREIIHNRTDIRVVSIGSGIDDFSGISFSSGDFVASVLKDSNLIINLFNYIKATTHEHWTRALIGSEHYHAFDFSLAKIDTYDGRYMADIRAMGEKLLQDNK